MSFDEYLAFEDQSRIRHEYVAGEVYAMSGTTLRHGRIVLNIASHLRTHARAHACIIVVSEVKLRAGSDRIYYPDLILACGPAAEVELIVEEPSLIVEVTSPGTQAIDRREKLDAYLKLKSLQTYLIVEQRQRNVVWYSRDARGEWLREEIRDAGDIRMPFLNMNLTMDQIYDDITLPPLTVKEGVDGDDEWTTKPGMGAGTAGEGRSVGDAHPECARSKD